MWRKIEGMLKTLIKSLKDIILKIAQSNRKLFLLTFDKGIKDDADMFDFGIARL
jgi:hypothetical protein